MSASLDQPWTRSLPARAARELLVCGAFGAIIDAYSRIEVVGRERLTELEGPAILVANHCSHVDTPVLLRCLPGPRRRRTAVLAAADYFYSRRLLAGAVSLTFGTVPLERGSRIGATTHVERLLDTGWNVLVFAEGTRSRDGRVGVMRSGAGMLAARCGVPLVPVHISGTHAAMPPGRAWMVRPKQERRHTIRVSFGAPIHVAQRAERFEAMERVRQFMAACGAQTTPDPKLSIRRAAAA